MQIYIVAAFMLGAADIEVNLYFVAFGEIVQETRLVLDAFEFDFLRILLGGGFEHKLPFRESTRKGLQVENGMDFSLNFEGRHDG